MFLQWSIPASLLPVYSLRLKQLGFHDLEIGLCAATQAVGVVLSSLLTGQIADRWFSAERAFALCGLLTALDLWVLAGLTQPLAVFLATLFFWLVSSPLVLLGTAICFTHLRDPEKRFGPVRMWGTIGWMGMGWAAGFWISRSAWPEAIRQFFSFCGPADRSDAFRLGALAALVVTGFSFTLPPTPPSTVRVPGRRLAPLAALRLLREGPFAVYCVCLFGICVTFPFTTQNTPLLLEQLGVPEGWLLPTLTIAQTTEVFALALLPVFMLRLGLRGTLLLGLCAWLTALSILSVGRPVGLVAACQALNGLFIACFLVAGQVFVNSRAQADLRASVQGLLSCINGAGLLLGHLLASWLRNRFANDLPATFSVVATLTAVLLLLFVVGFRPLAVPNRGSRSEETP
jgi:MFS family permease